MRVKKSAEKKSRSNGGVFSEPRNNTASAPSAQGVGRLAFSAAT